MKKTNVLKSIIAGIVSCCILTGVIFIFAQNNSSINETASDESYLDENYGDVMRIAATKQPTTTKKPTTTTKAPTKTTTKTTKPTKTPTKAPTKTKTPTKTTAAPSKTKTPTKTTAAPTKTKTPTKTTAAPTKTKAPNKTTSAPTATIGKCDDGYGWDATKKKCVKCTISVSLKGSPQRISQGDPITATISSTCTNTKVDCSNISVKCDGVGTYSGTVVKACTAVSVSAS